MPRKLPPLDQSQWRALAWISDRPGGGVRALALHLYPETSRAWAEVICQEQIEKLGQLGLVYQRKLGIYLTKLGSDTLTAFRNEQPTPQPRPRAGHTAVQASLPF